MVSLSFHFREENKERQKEAKGLCFIQRIAMKRSKTDVVVLKKVV